MKGFGRGDLEIESRVATVIDCLRPAETMKSCCRETRSDGPKRAVGDGRSPGCSLRPHDLANSNTDMAKERDFSSEPRTTIPLLACRLCAELRRKRLE